MTAIKKLIQRYIGGWEDSQSTSGAAAAATIELRETARVARRTAAKIKIKTRVAQGANAKKTPTAVATPFPPLKRKNTEYR